MSGKKLEEFYLHGHFIKFAFRLVYNEQILFVNLNWVRLNVDVRITMKAKEQNKI